MLVSFDLLISKSDVSVFSGIPVGASTLSRLLEIPPISTSPAAKALAATQSAAFMQSSVPKSADKKGQPQQGILHKAEKSIRCHFLQTILSA